MVAFVMFWAALFAMSFFVVGTLFKALASAFQALLNFAFTMVAYVIFFCVVVLGASAFYEIVDGIVTGNLKTAITNILFVVVLCVILFGLLGWLGAVILELAMVAIDVASRFVSFVLEGIASVCEKGYAKSLNMIVKRIEKC